MERFKNTYISRTYQPVPESIFEVAKQGDFIHGDHDVIGGISSDTVLSWMALGASLQVFYTATGEVKSLWCFGNAAKEPNAQVTCVEELKAPFKNVTLFVVGLKYGSHNGMVCIFDSACTKVLRAIEIPEEVTFIHVVSTGYSSTIFPGQLSAFDGILAVGTAGGRVFIIDMCKELLVEARKISGILDIRNETRPSQLKILSPSDVYDLENLKIHANRDEMHLAILLNERETSGKHFELKTPQGRNVIFAAKDEVKVSTLHYAPQLCSLFIGYNFGALQVWNFLSMSLEYTSPVQEEKIPVSFIAVQEPVDDPRAFCYFWAVYSCTGQYHNVFPLAALYALSYESKDYHEGYGHIYQNLQNCVVRFQANLRTMDTSLCKSPLGANCIRLQAYTRGINNPNSSLTATTPEESYTLCMMAWNVKCDKHKVHTYMSLFDLNQWYKEQMPSLPHQDQCQNYMSHVCITDVTSCNEFMLDVYIDPATIDPYVGTQKLEEHYRPSSLAYNVITLCEVDVCKARNMGAQRYFFRELEEQGPLALMYPADIYTNARQLGLAPLFADMPLESTHQQQCEILLSIALERKMLKWLSKCAVSWGNGSHRSVGLSLELLLQWAWERTRILKHSADQCCSCLFDYSGTKLDSNLHSMITACRVQFGTLRDLYAHVMKNCSAFLIHPDITKQQHMWMVRNYVYFNVVGWMINLNLLPESNEIYPMEKMRQNYAERRQYLRSLQNGANQQKHHLLIDSLTDVGSIKSEWQEDGGDGEYPPSTLQLLLRCYLNNDIEIKSAHILVGYTLLDLVMLNERNQHENIEQATAAMIKFPQIFDMSMNMMNMIQAFWKFDHGHIEAAINQLSNSTIQDIQHWQHRFIINILRMQGHYRMALMYWQSRNIRGEKEDVKISIQLKVRNNMLHEALCIERRHADAELLEAFFAECLLADLIMDLTTFNFTSDEERALLEFLEKSNYQKCEDFKTAYFVRRGRFLDFYLHQNASSSDRNSLSKEVKHSLDASLPSITRKIIKTCVDLRSSNYVDKKPLSAFVCDKKERAKFNNDFVKAAIVNSKNSWSARQFITEDDYPFMRNTFNKTTPQPKNVIYPKIVDAILPHTVEERDADVGPPAKRMRFCQSNDEDEELMNMTTIETMHFQRSDIMTMSYQAQVNATTTPHSILKSSYRGDTSEVCEVERSRRSVTPRIAARTPIANTSSVRFTSISSDSSNSSAAQQASAAMSHGKETSSTSTYYSAETSSPQVLPGSNRRKRKLLLENDVQEESVPVLTSSSFTTIGDKSAHSYLEAIHSPVNTTGLNEHTPVTTEQFTNVSATLNKDDVFVFVGNDEPSPKILTPKLLTPKSRDTYQTSPPKATSLLTQSASKQSTPAASNTIIVIDDSVQLSNLPAGERSFDFFSDAYESDANDKTSPPKAKPLLTQSASKQSTPILRTRKSLSRRVLEANASKVLHEKEIRTETKTCKTTIREVTRNIDNEIVDTVEQQTEVQESSKVMHFTETVEDEEDISKIIDESACKEVTDKSITIVPVQNSTPAASNTIIVIDDSVQLFNPTAGERSFDFFSDAYESDANASERVDKSGCMQKNKSNVANVTTQIPITLAPQENLNASDSVAMDVDDRSEQEVHLPSNVLNDSSITDYFSETYESFIDEAKYTQKVDEAAQTNEDCDGVSTEEQIDKESQHQETKMDEPVPPVVEEPSNKVHEKSEDRVLVDTVEEKTVSPKKRGRSRRATKNEDDENPPKRISPPQVHPLTRRQKLLNEERSDEHTDENTDSSMPSSSQQVDKKFDPVVLVRQISSNTLLEKSRKFEATEKKDAESPSDAIVAEADKDSDVQSVQSSGQYITDPVMNNYTADPSDFSSAKITNWQTDAEQEMSSPAFNDDLPFDQLSVDSSSVDSVKTDNKVDLNAARVEDVTTTKSWSMSNSPSPIPHEAADDISVIEIDSDSSNSRDSADVCFIGETSAEITSVSESWSNSNSANSSLNKAICQSASESITELSDTSVSKPTSSNAEQQNGRTINELSTIIEEGSVCKSSTLKASEIESPVPVQHRSNRRRSVDSPPPLTITLRSRRSSAASENDSPAVEKPVPKAMARTRSMSVDSPPATPARRSSRTRSADGLEEKKDTPKKRVRARRASEENPPKKFSPPLSRPLTRRQKLLNEQSSLDEHTDDGSNSPMPSSSFTPSRGRGRRLTKSLTPERSLNSSADARHNKSRTSGRPNMGIIAEEEEAHVENVTNVASNAKRLRPRRNSSNK